jgi:hypothetical protein
LFHHVNKAVVLVKNQIAQTVSVTTGKKTAAFEAAQAGDYTIVTLNEPESGSYEINGGDVLFAMQYGEWPAIIKYAGLAAAVLVLIIIIFAVTRIIKKIIEPPKAWAKVICECQGSKKNLADVEIYLRKKKRSKNQFESGASLKNIISAMPGVIAQVNKCIGAAYPKIINDGKNWHIQCDPAAGAPISGAVFLKPGAGGDWSDMLRQAEESDPESTDAPVKELSVENRTVVFDSNNRFEVENVFEDKTYKLFFVKSTN